MANPPLKLVFPAGERVDRGDDESRPNSCPLLIHKRWMRHRRMKQCNRRQSLSKPPLARKSEICSYVLVKGVCHLHVVSQDASSSILWLPLVMMGQVDKHITPHEFDGVFLV